MATKAVARFLFLGILLIGVCTTLVESAPAEDPATSDDRSSSSDCSLPRNGCLMFECTEGSNACMAFCRERTSFTGGECTEMHTCLCYTMEGKSDRTEPAPDESRERDADYD